MSANPSCIGRFLVLDRIGAGGRGTVFRAYDRQLERRVAVKLLGAETTIADERAALAKVSHPNVIAIHELGRSDGHAFVAMEYVDGLDLARWMHEHPHGDSRRIVEGLAILQQAGRGLGAAHAAGAVHGNVKPSNVLVGSDGRVRVVDFGLVHDAAAPYVAPEQRRGEPASARSDQFSFCVTAWELVSGRAPWSGDPCEPLDMPSHAPRRILDVLARGLRIDPAARHPDMSALLAALARNPTRRRRWFAGAAAAITAAAAATAAVVHHRATLCDDGPDALARVWNDERRTSLAATFAASDIAMARDAWPRTETQLAAFADEWLTIRNAVCDAGRRRGELAQERTELILACLDLRLVHFEATLSVVEAGDDESLAFAAPAAHSLRPPHACESGASETMRLPSGEAREQTLDMMRGIMIARLVGGRGDWDSVLAHLDALEPSIAELDYVPVSLRAAETRVIALDQLERDDVAIAVGVDAYWSALRHGEDAMAAAIALRLALLAIDGEAWDDAENWVQYARVFGERAAYGPVERSMVEATAGRLAFVRGDFEGSKVITQRALELATSIWGVDHPQLTPFYSTLVSVHRRLNETDESIRVARKALAIDEAAYGPDALQTAQSVMELSNALSEAGQNDEALALGQRGVDTLAAWLGDDNPRAAQEIANLGITAKLADRPEQAIALLRRAMVGLAALPKTHNAVLLTRLSLADASSMVGDTDAALEIARDVVARYEESWPANHPFSAEALSSLGTILAKRREYDEATTVLERALAIHTATVGADNVSALSVRVDLARIRLERGEAQHAADEIASILAQAAGDDMGEARGLALALQGEIFERLRRPDDAIASYEGALPLLHGPRDRVELLQRRVALHLELGHADAARRDAQLGLDEARALPDGTAERAFARTLAPP
ncbi:MAG TPA: tetratricopeptide repeat protein [Nannocystaceae bacterium]|nr:tetratricopeptide repeat protein [Nannocystaceae bacterium]